MIHIEPNRGYSKTCSSCHNGPTHLKWYFFPYPLFVDCWSSWKYYRFNSVTVSSFITLSFLWLVYLYHYDRCAFLISWQARLLAGFLVDWYINTGAYERCFIFFELTVRESNAFFIQYYLKSIRRKTRALPHMSCPSMFILLNCFACVIRANTDAFMIEDAFFIMTWYTRNNMRSHCNVNSLPIATRALFLLSLNKFFWPWNWFQLWKMIAAHVDVCVTERERCVMVEPELVWQ